MKLINTIYAASLLIGATSTLNAGNLTASSHENDASVSIHSYSGFTDTPQWSIISQTHPYGYAYGYNWVLHDIVSDVDVITIEKSPATANSLHIDSQGVLRLAKSSIVISSENINIGNSIYVNKSNDHTGIATYMPSPDYELTVGYGGDILLRDGNNGWGLLNSSGYFRIYDETNHRTPFMIYDDALSNSLVIQKSGYIGLGTAYPKAKLDVRGDAIVNGELNTTKAITSSLSENSTKNTKTLFSLSRNNTNTSSDSDVSFALENAHDDFKWTFRTLQSDQGFAISKVGSGEKEMVLTGNDHVDGIQLLMGDGGKYSDGQWMVASSRAYKENIEEIDAQTALKAFHQLKPVSFNYKTNKGEAVVGFIAEDVPEIVASKGRDALSAMEMVALLTKVVQVQEEDLKSKDAEMVEMKAKQKAENESMQKRLSKVESLLTNLALETSNQDKDQLSVNIK